jgi:hypothetical protein
VTDDDFTPQELAEMQAALHLIAAERDVKEAADGGAVDDRKVHYERVKGVASPGSFRLPHHAVEALGAGDGRTAGMVLKQLFAVDADSPDIVPAETVQALGHGDHKTGHRVLNRFVQMLRKGKAESRNAIPQPDGNSPL